MKKLFHINDKVKKGLLSKGRNSNFCGICPKAPPVPCRGNPDLVPPHNLGRPEVLLLRTDEKVLTVLSIVLRQRVCRPFVSTISVSEVFTGTTDTGDETKITA